MFQIKDLCSRCLSVFPILVFFVFSSAGNALAIDCKVISKDLNASYNGYDKAGGLWTLLESFEALEGKSMLGMQADSKLRRAVTIYENNCESDPKNSKVKLARRIADLIDQGKMITNNKSGNVPIKKILESVEALLVNANKLLAEIDK